MINARQQAFVNQPSKFGIGSPYRRQRFGGSLVETDKMKLVWFNGCGENATRYSNAIHIFHFLLLFAMVALLESCVGSCLVFKFLRTAGSEAG